MERATEPRTRHEASASRVRRASSRYEPVFRQVAGIIDAAGQSQMTKFYLLRPSERILQTASEKLSSPAAQQANSAILQTASAHSSLSTERRGCCSLRLRRAAEQGDGRRVPDQASGREAPRVGSRSRTKGAVHAGRSRQRRTRRIKANTLDQAVLDEIVCMKQTASLLP